MGEFLKATSRLTFMQKPLLGVLVGSFASVNTIPCDHAKNLLN